MDLLEANMIKAQNYPIMILTMILALFVIMQGCATVKPVVGSEQIVEKSNDDKPDWITQIPEETEKDYFFRGAKTSALSLDAGLSDSRKLAIGQVVSFISSLGMEDYSNVRREHGIPDDDEDVATIIEDGVRVLSKNIARAVKELETYYEKVEKVTHEGVKYYYNVYMLVKYPKEEYVRALRESTKKQKEQAKAENNKKAVEFLDKMNDRFMNVEY